MQALSPREMEMVELTAFGLAQKEIAERLRLSIHTVDVTLRHAKEKLHIQKSTELSAWYFITRYHIRIDLPKVKRAMISLSFLSLMAISIAHGFKPERAARTLRTSRRHNTELFTL